MHAAMLGRPGIKCKPASCQPDFVYAISMSTKRQTRPSYRNWAAMLLRMLREDGGHEQEEYAVLLSERLGVEVPFGRTWVTEQESGRSTIDAAVMLAAYVQSGLPPEEIVRKVMKALLAIPASDYLDITRDMSGGQGKAEPPPRIRDLVKGLHEADGADETPREKRRVGRQQG